MRVVIVPNIENALAVAAATELATWLSGLGLEAVLVHSDAQATGLDNFGIARSDLGQPAMAVALGGDGTILKAVHLLGDVDVPLLGVKFGRLGFLSGASPDRMREAIEATLAGDVRIERRATLKAEAIMDGRVVGAYRALNEVVVSRGASARVVALDIAIDGRTLMDVRADGVIIATATGSTAYALSAGGPIVAPSFQGMVVVPVAPHRLATRAIVTEPHDTVEITLPDPSRADACVTVDGEAMPCRRSLDKLTVSRGQHDVSLVKLEGRDFYDTVAHEFFGGR